MWGGGRGSRYADKPSAPGDISNITEALYPSRYYHYFTPTQENRYNNNNSKGEVLPVKLDEYRKIKPIPAAYLVFKRRNDNTVSLKDWVTRDIAPPQTHREKKYDINNNISNNNSNNSNNTKQYDCSELLPDSYCFLSRPRQVLLNSLDNNNNNNNIRTISTLPLELRIYPKPNSTSDSNNNNNNNISEKHMKIRSHKINYEKPVRRGAMVTIKGETVPSLSWQGVRKGGRGGARTTGINNNINNNNNERSIKMEMEAIDDEFGFGTKSDNNIDNKGNVNDQLVGSKRAREDGNNNNNNNDDGEDAVSVNSEGENSLSSVDGDNDDDDENLGSDGGGSDGGELYI